MKTIFLKDNDISKFLDEICGEVEKGETVEISMYGYKAYAYPTSSKDSIRLAIIKKLRTIKTREINLNLLREHTSLTEEEVMQIDKNYTPEDIAEMCLEYGLIGTTYRHSL